MKKVALIAVLFSLMSLNANAQWFDLTQNLNRGVVGFPTGLMGYNNVSDMSLSDLSVGISLNVAGVYLDFVYVTSDHMYDSHIGTENSSIFHKYHSTRHRNDFNYVGMLTMAPCKYFEINATFTTHAAYAGIAFNLTNFEYCEIERITTKLI